MNCTNNDSNCDYNNITTFSRNNSPDSDSNCDYNNITAIILLIMTQKAQSAIPIVTTMTPSVFM